MLHSLFIKNFVLVESLDLALNDGLTIVTGETGAGKSILVDALDLLLGGRADSGVVRQGCEETEIVAGFDLNPAVNAWLEAQSLSSNGDCLLRRVVSRNGRSRAYINGSPVTVQALRDIGDLLVDIHSQHAHQTLLKPEVQRQLLDGMSEDSIGLGAVSATYTQWKQLRDTLRDLGGNSADRAAQIELLSYQVQELETLELASLDLDALNEEHRRLAHASQLLESTQSALDRLDGEHGAALASLNQAGRELETVLVHDPRLQPILETLNSAAIQAQEALSELRHYSENLELDPARLDWVEQRLADLQNMARKHQISVAELPLRLAELSSRLEQLENYEQRADRLERELQQTLENYRQAAAALYEQRTRTALSLAAQIDANIRKLGMPKGRFAVQVHPSPDAPPSPHGTDKVEFLVSANPGQPLKPLNKVVSGGELSRISLAVQVITAQGSAVPTLVFDEVDVGVGGGVAEIVGQQLHALGQRCQVLCITHLPQVAAYGNQHLQVAKFSEGDTTRTELHGLDRTQRVQELARMLGGLEITPQTLAHAEEMLLKSTLR